VTTIIAAIETDGPGGAEQMLMRLARAGRDRGIHTVVCLIREGWLARECRAAGHDVVINPLTARLDVGYIARLHALIRERRASGVHAHEFACSVHGAIAATLAGVPCVATVHGRAYYGETRARRTAIRLASRLASMTAVSEDIRAYLVAECGVHPDRVTVVPNGLQLRDYQRVDARRDSARAQASVREGDLVIGALGSYYPVKGHRDLVEAMPQVLAAFPRAVLLLAGQGALASALAEQAEALGVSSRVRVVGYQADPRDFLAALDLFVMPSHSEGMPLALLEAAAMARPIVATAVGGMPQLIEDGMSGLLVPPADPAALARAITRLLGDHALAARCAREASARVTTRWSIDRVAERYAALLRIAPRP
jgi:glycosyltransferase involved in cell wall biosynthesis